MLEQTVSAHRVRQQKKCYNMINNQLCVNLETETCSTVSMKQKQQEKSLFMFGVVGHFVTLMVASKAAMRARELV